MNSGKEFNKRMISLSPMRPSLRIRVGSSMGLKDDHFSTFFCLFDVFYEKINSNSY